MIDIRPRRWIRWGANVLILVLICEIISLGKFGQAQMSLFYTCLSATVAFLATAIDIARRAEFRRRVPVIDVLMLKRNVELVLLIGAYLLANISWLNLLAAQ